MVIVKKQFIHVVFKREIAMPNHVLHRMVITGEAESIRELHDACFAKEKPAPDEWLLGALEQARNHGDAEKEKELAAHVAEIKAAPEYDVFDFNRIIPAPAFIMRAGNLKSGSREEKTGRNWYEWNTRNWGTKWGAYDLHIEEREPERLAFRFSTAWSVPEPVLGNTPTMMTGRRRNCATASAAS